MRPVARILAATMAASVLSVATPAAQAAPVSASAAATTAAASSTPAPTAAELRQQRIIKKKKAIKRKKALKRKRAIIRGRKIVSTAARYKGTPYKWGGSSPSGFDCAGLVKYVVKKSVKKTMPRVAGAQMKKGTKVFKRNKRKGDLIGFYNSSGVYHIGIYAGGNKIWHSPRPGKRVEKVKIWTSAYKVRRI